MVGKSIISGKLKTKMTLLLLTFDRKADIRY